MGLVLNLAGYIRVSTEGQVDAYGKDVQRRYITDWAEMNAHVITAWFEEDGISGKTDVGDRPAMSEILERSVEFDGIVFFDATRIARLYIVQETLLGLLWAAGLHVFTTTAGELSADEDDPTKILIRQVLAIVAEFDHRTTVRKLHAARKLKSAAGGFVGGTPAYGLRVVGTGKSAQFEVDELESHVVQSIVKWHNFGNSLHWIAKRLNDSGNLTKRGKQWTPVQVSRIIKRYNDDHRSQTQG